MDNYSVKFANVMFTYSLLTRSFQEMTSTGVYFAFTGFGQYYT